MRQQGGKVALCLPTIGGIVRLMVTVMIQCMLDSLGWFNECKMMEIWMERIWLSNEYSTVAPCWLTLKWEKINSKCNARCEGKTANNLVSMGWWISVVSETNYDRDSTSRMFLDREFGWSEHGKCVAKRTVLLTLRWGEKTKYLAKYLSEKNRLISMGWWMGIASGTRDSTSGMMRDRASIYATEW